MEARAFSKQCVHIGIGWLPEQDGGLNRVYYELMQELPRTGLGTIGLVQGTALSAAETEGRIQSFAPFDVPLWSRWQGVRRTMKTMMREHDVSLVVSHFALYTFPVLDLIRDLPHVIHFQGPWAFESKVEGAGTLTVQAKRMLEQAVYNRGNRFIVLSEAFRDILRDTYHVPEDRIDIVACGVNAQSFYTGVSQAQARTRLGWAQDRPIVFCIRRLVHRMGIENLVAAIDAVRRDVPDVLLMIAGKGPLTPVLAEQIRAAGLEQHVQLLGFVPEEDLPFAYRAADLTVVPSVALEGMGCITLESMAAGTPVLVTPVGGLPEAVRDLSPELVLPDTSVAALQAGITDAFMGRLRLPDSQACIDYVRARFDWPIIAAQVRDVYMRALTEYVN